MNEYYGGAPEPAFEWTKRRTVVATCAALAVASGLTSWAYAANAGSERHNPNATASGGASASPSPEGYVVEGATDYDRSCNMLLDANEFDKNVTTQDITTGIKDASIRSKTLRLYALGQADATISAANVDAATPSENIASWKTISMPSAQKQAGEYLVQDALHDQVSSAIYGSTSTTAENANAARTIITTIKSNNTKELASVATTERLAATFDAAEPGSDTYTKLRDKLSNINDVAQGKADGIAEDISNELHPDTNAICAKSGDAQQRAKDAKAAQEAYDTACDALVEPVRDTCEADHAIDKISGIFVTDPKSSIEWSERVSEDNSVEQARIDTAEADKAIYFAQTGNDDTLAGPWIDLVTTPAEKARVDAAVADKAIQLVQDGNDALGLSLSKHVTNPDQVARVDTAYADYVRKVSSDGNNILGSDVADQITDPILRKQMQALANN